MCDRSRRNDACIVVVVESTAQTRVVQTTSPRTAPLFSIPGVCFTEGSEKWIFTQRYVGIHTETV
jgi:hypothetical protein